MKTFKKFAKLDCDKVNCQYNLLKRLIAMFAPNVIGHDDVKLGLLRSIVGGDSHGDPKNGFIDTFMVGDPGTAKSTLGREATKIKPNSRHVSAPHATTKSITGIVDKENEGYTLRLGSIPLAKNAICAIDEITAWPPEEQSQLLDALEDREFDIEKYGRHYKVPAPTTIIATANPIGSSWQDKKIISFDQVSMVGKLLDRFKQIYIFRDGMNEEQDIDEFTERLSIINERKPHNYNFLTGYLIHASNIKIRAITPEAKFMLNQFWKKAKVQGTLGVGIRMLKGLFTIAEAHAKLHLKDVVDATIAKQAMESEQLRMFRYGQSVRVTPDPKDVTYNKCLEILERIQAGIAIRELFEMARDSDQQISAYIGTNLSMEHNRKIQVIVHMLRNNSHIKQVGINLVVLQWIGGKSEPELQILPDIPDIPDMTKNKSTKENDEKTSQSDVVQKKVMSGVSGVSGSPFRMS